MNRKPMDREVTIKAAKLISKIKDIAIKDLGIPNIDVCISDIGRSYGILVPKEKKVYISNTITDINVFIDCIFHELRHVYQILNNKSILENYSRGTCKEDYSSYYNHPSEIDAREYAIDAMKRYEKEIRELKFLYRRGKL